MGEQEPFANFSRRFNDSDILKILALLKNPRTIEDPLVQKQLTAAGVLPEEIRHPEILVKALQAYSQSF